ncbi:MAG TPA: hypothetical protein VLL52_15330 [Anaerolineae bacterium]|nr:hypothetical protein [Anaerolineae bacterium]
MKKLTFLTLILILLLTACGGSASDGTEPARDTGSNNNTGNTDTTDTTDQSGQEQVKIYVDTVEATVAADNSIDLHVTGTIGDACNTLEGVAQKRDGNNVTVTITALRQTGVACAELAQLYDETIRLDGVFEPGDYNIKVNDIASSVTVDTQTGVTMPDSNDNNTSLPTAPDSGVAPRDDQPTQPSSEQISLPPTLTKEILADAAQFANTDLANTKILAVLPTEWPDASLGCPQPDQMYAQMITPGARVLVNTGAKKIVYHTSLSGQFVRCDTVDPNSIPLPKDDAIAPTQPTKLGVGDTITIDGVDITFVEVTEDSRCPVGVTCVWEGQVGVKLTLNTQNQLVGETTLTSVRAPQQTVGKHTVTLVEVGPPLNKDGSALTANDYYITLTLTDAPAQ